MSNAKIASYVDSVTKVAVSDDIKAVLKTVEEESNRLQKRIDQLESKLVKIAENIERIERMGGADK